MASASIANDQSADRSTLVVHADVDTILDEDKNGVLAGGLPIPPEATALIACDSRVQTVLHDENGDIFHIGSPTYVVPKCYVVRSSTATTTAARSPTAVARHSRTYTTSFRGRKA